MPLAVGTVVERTLTLGRKLIIRPKIISKGEGSDGSPGAAFIAF